MTSDNLGGHVGRPRPVTRAPDQWLVTCAGEIVDVAGSLDDALTSAERIRSFLERRGWAVQMIEIAPDDLP